MTDFRAPGHPEQPDPFPAVLHDLLDGRLDADAADGLRARIAADPVLSEAWEELRRIQGWVRAHGPQGAALEPPPALRRGLDARLAALRAGDSETTASQLSHPQPSHPQPNDPRPNDPQPSHPQPNDPQPTDPRPMPAEGGRPGRLLRTLTLAYAAAALLVVGFSLVYITSLDPTAHVPGEGGAPQGDLATIEQADLDVDDAAPAERAERDGLAADAPGGEDDGEATAGLASKNGAQDERQAEARRARAKDAEAPRDAATPFSKAAESEKRPDESRPRASGTPVKRVADDLKKAREGAAESESGGRVSGPYGAPGGATPVKLRKPSDKPAPATGRTAEAPAPGPTPTTPSHPTRPASAPAPAKAPSESKAPPASKAPPSSPTTEAPRTPKVPTLADKPGEPTPSAPAPSPADAPAGGSMPPWGFKTGPLARAGRQLANGDTVYVLETDDPVKARVALLALLDQAAAGAADAPAKKKARGAPAESPPAPAREPGLGGGGGVQAGSPVRADRFYRVDAPALVRLGARVQGAVVDPLVVHSALSRERTATLAALLELRAAQGAWSAPGSGSGQGSSSGEGAAIGRGGGAGGGAASGARKRGAVPKEEASGRSSRKQPPPPARANPDRDSPKSGAPKPAAPKSDAAEPDAPAASGFAQERKGGSTGGGTQPVAGKRPTTGKAREKKTGSAKPASASDAKAPQASGAAGKPSGRVRILIIQRR